jgi:hypothetical protein
METWFAKMYVALGWPVETATLLAVARSDFEVEHKAAADRLWGLKKLRGADTDDELKGILASIANVLKQTKDQVAAAQDVSGIEAARAQVRTLEAKAKQAETVAKRAEADYARDLEAMQKYLASLEAARKDRDTIAGLPGATEQLVAIEKLLADGQAKVIKDGMLTRGHAAGLAILTGRGTILEQARTTSAAYVKKEIPRAVQDAWMSAKSKLVAHEKIAPEFQTRLYEKQLAEALASGREDAAKAVKEIEAILTVVEEEVRNQRALLETAKKDLTAVGVLLGELAAAGLPEAGYAHVQQEKIRAEAMLADGVREYRSAAEILKESKEVAGALLATHKVESKKWATQAKTLGEIKRSCLEWKQWLPLLSRAQNLLDDATELEQAVAAGHDYAAGTERLTRLEARHAIMEAEAKDSIPRGANLKEFAQACLKAKGEVDEARKEVGLALTKLEEKLAGVENPKATEKHLALVQCYDAWLKFVNVPTADAVKTLEAKKKTTIEELRAIEQNVASLLKKPADLEKLVTEAKAAEEERAKAGRMDKIESLLKELEKFKVDVAAERQQAGDALRQQLDPGWGTVKLLEQNLTQKLAEARKAHAAKQKKAAEVVAGNKAALERLESDNRNFAPYVKELKARANDLEALVADGDPYLYELAVQESAELIVRMKAISPEFRPSGAKTFDDVEAKHAAMSKELGQGDLIKKRLPDTYADLYARLVAVLVRAREADPDAGLKLLEPLALEITAAGSKAATEDAVFKNFEGEKKLVEARWNEITKLTKTWITDRTKAYEARFKTQVAEATKTASEENKINEAIQKLTAIKAGLDAIASAPDPRQALQDEDAKASREQKLVTDMAAQFEAALETYEKTTLPKLRAALKGAKAADQDQIDSLEKASAHAAKIVQPYLDLLSKLPHKRLLANSAPLPEKATADFAQAQKMLANATRSAQLLTANPEGANVKFTGDLTRVAAEWVKYANAYAAGLKGLATAINKESETEGAEIRKAAKKVTAELEKTATRFDAVAFAGPLQVLSNAKAAAEAKLAAREDALRIVRDYKRDMLANPLLVRINDPQNPFKNLNRETGMLRATLKKIELEVLGGV